MLDLPPTDGWAGYSEVSVRLPQFGTTTPSSGPWELLAPHFIARVKCLPGQYAGPTGM